VRASLDLRKHEGSEGARGGASGLARFDLGVARFPSPFALRKSQRFVHVSTGLKRNHFRRLNGIQFGHCMPSRQHAALPPRQWVAQSLGSSETLRLLPFCIHEI